METTKEDVVVLLENFDDYINPAGDEDPWFTYAEINQQFAWEDVSEPVLGGWVSDLVLAGKVEWRDDTSRGRVFRWLS